MAILAVTVAVAPAQTVRSPARGLAGWAKSFPAFFIENRGVYPDRVRFFVEHQDGVVLFEDDRVILRSLDRHDDDIHIAFPGVRKGVVAQGIQLRPTVVSYFSGPEPEWRCGLRTFGEIVYREIWPGIDLLFRGERNSLKYEFRVSPGANPAHTRLLYEGADRVEVGANGDLSVRVKTRVLRDPRPVAWQTIGGLPHPVATRFQVCSSAKGLVGFEVGSYDSAHELVIDPAMLIYCGYAGPTRNVLTDLAVDSSGSAYLLGMDFDPAQARHDGLRVMKVSPDGTRLDYVAVINGAAYDAAEGIAVDAQGCVYVVGNTWSDETSFPVKVGPSLQLNKNLIPVDGFILKLAPGGTSIVYCGYIGGSHQDWAKSVVLDATGAAWVTGATASLDLPVKGGPMLTKPVPSGFEAFVAKVTPYGRSLLVCGYMGGSYDDYGYDIAVDPKGDAYFCGLTTSPDFPVKWGPGQSWGGGNNGFDGFVAKIDGQNGSLIYSGYVGGNGDDDAEGIAVDASGAAYITGYTASDLQSFPAKVGPYLLGTPGFVAKVMPSGNGYIYCGRFPDGSGSDIVIDDARNVYITGSGGGNLPVQNGPNSRQSGMADAFVAKVPSYGVGFVWAGYIGGVNSDTASDIARDSVGNVYVIGRTDSDEQTFPVKVGPSLHYNGGPPPLYAYGAFVAKVAESAITPTGTGRIGTPITFSLLASDDSGLPYHVGTSFGSGPIALGSRSLGLSPDALLVESVGGNHPGTFQDYSGWISANATATATLHLPNAPALVGLRLYTAFVTLDTSEPFGIKSISDTTMFAIAK
jgi:beta-propeller repeat-containing protein